ncbi:MAG: glycosyltransferase family 2 protein [Candidatus Berkelbacteria bacterium]|nr:glycosyltransferase family 2 protein [Candidatus Berkelbacteria bacterium]
MTDQREKLPVSVIMLTLNEEFHLSDAIENVKGWAQEIFIVDSCSTDRTIDIALEHGVNVVQRPFTNFGDQWNFALGNLPIKTPWTFKLDPDERLSEDLKDSIAKIVTNKAEYTGYEMNLRLWFMGKPLHVLMPVLRLWRTGKCRFSDVIVNERQLIDGDVGRVEGLMEHFDSPDLHHWWDKQNRYTTMLAIQKVKGQQLSVEPKLFGTALERRMFFIKMFFRIPFRYQLQWVHEVLIRGAWRDGRTGLAWARLRVQSRRMRELKAIEMEITGRVLELPVAPHGGFDSRVINSPFQRIVCGESEQKKSPKGNC